MFSQTVFAAVLLKVKSTDRPSRCVSSSAPTSWGRRYYRKDDSLRQFWGKKTGSHRRLSPPVSSISYRGSCSPAGGRDLFVLEGGWKVKGRSGKEGRGRRPRALKLSVPLLCWQNRDRSINPSQDGERKQEKKKREASKRLLNTGDGDETEGERMRRSWGDVGDIKWKGKKRKWWMMGGKRNHWWREIMSTVAS